MATVRELVAKFGFDIDIKPVKEFNSEFNKLKKGLKTFVLYKTLKGFVQIGKEFDQIRRNMGLFGNELEALQIVQGLDRIVSSTDDASRAVRNSLEELGDIEFTRRIIQDAEDFAAITGESIDDIMGMLSQAAAGGSLEPLQRLGLTNQQEIEALQRMNIEMRTATIKQIILNRLSATREQRQKKLLKATKDLDIQQSRFGKIIEDFGLIIAKFINPILSAMLEIFNDFAEFMLTSPIAQFVGKILALAGGLKVLLSVGRLLFPVFRILASAISGLFSIFSAAAAAIGFLVVWIHDLWAAFSDPTAAWFFSADSNKYFKSWVDDLKELGETFEWISGKVGDFFDMLGNIGGSALSFVADSLNFVTPQATNGVGEQINKTANITISADTIEAARAGSQEAISFLKSQGFTVNETTLNQLRARAATSPGG